MRNVAISLGLVSLLPIGDTKLTHTTLVVALGPPASPAANAAALTRVFMNPTIRTLNIPAGIYLLPCGTSLAAAGSLSVIGEGVGRTVLRLDRRCVLDRALMTWTSKSGVRLSGLTIDLNDGHSPKLQNVLEFEAYKGSAEGLEIDHIAIVNGNTLSLQIAVGAAGGFSYSGVVIDSNLLETTAGRTQNQCIALTTVNGLGTIPTARVTNNVCRGSAIQVDGEGTFVARNNVSGYQFGAGIFTAPVTKRVITAADWISGVVTLRYESAPNSFTPDETIHVWGATPASYNGTYRILRTTNESVSFAMARSPGIYVGGGFAAPDPSSRDCVIRDNILHDTPQTLDVNGSAPGGIENNCVASVVENNRAIRVGGAGFGNFANGARYVGNRASGVGYRGRGSAGGESDQAGFVVFDNGSGLPWYRSSDLVFERNVSEPFDGFPRFGYYEEPWHLFNVRFRANSFRGMAKSMVVRSASCLPAPVRC